MSYEVWGDDDAGDYDHLLEAGWWPSEQADAVKRAINELRSEPIYEGGEKANGVSARFLMRITVLAHEAGLLADDDMFVQEAQAAFASGGQPKYSETFCSQCGQKFGPGDHGFSHCSDHQTETQKAEQRVADLRIALNAGEYDGDIPIEFFESALEKI